MRTVLALICISIVFCGASAAQPDAAGHYLAARNRYIGQFKIAPPDGPRTARALDDLDRQLNQIVPRWSAPGFPRRGKINLQTLVDELDFALLDGIVYKAGDTSVLVTTRTLLQQWLAEEKDRWHGKPDFSTVLPDAYRDGGFYTQALSNDAAAFLYGPLPVRTSSTGRTIAQLAGFGQDLLLGSGPTTLLVVAERGDRIFIAEQTLKAPTVSVPVCRSLMEGILARARAAAARNTEQSFQLEQDADRAYRLCFARYLSQQPQYGAIVQQAQTLADLLD